MSGRVRQTRVPARKLRTVTPEEPDAGAEEQFENQAVAMGQRVTVAAHDLSQAADFALGQGCGRLHRRRR